MLKFFLSVLLFIPANSCVFAQDKVKKLDSLFDAYASSGMLSGTVLVAEKGKIIYQGSYGIADFEWNVPVTNDTKYLIGSLSKQFIAVLILQLLQENKLKLSDKVVAYLPQMTGEKGDITIHQLLSHTSGLSHFNGMEGFMNTWQSRYTRQEWLTKLLALPFRKQGQGTYSYSGPGYFILGMIVEKLRGMPLKKAYRKYIFEPAGMKDSYSIEEMDVPIGKVASAYIATATGPVKGRYRDASTMAGVGDIVTTVYDYFLYDRALRKDILLQQPFLRLLLTPYTESEGYSLSFTKYISPETKDTSTLVFFTGQLSGYTSLAYHAWEDDKLIVTFYNVDNPGLYDIGDKAFRILYGRNTQPPKKSLTKFLYDNSVNGSLQQAVAKFLALPEAERNLFQLSPAELNRMGYSYLERGMHAEAILVFQLNTSLFPKAADLYDSLGEAYFVSGDYKLALANYQKALEMDPQHQNAANMIERIKKVAGLF